ncbi:MAG: VOC family protein [Christensenellales bacterium]|jgi:lactoylglutathione lyase
MKLNFITFMVRDIQKSVAFYQELVGLNIINRINLEAGEIVFLANAKGETMIELIEFGRAEKVTTKGMVMSFSAETALEDLREKVIALGYSPSDIIDKGPKPKHFTVLDPDGIVVEFSV